MDLGDHCKFNADALLDLTQKVQMKMMIKMATLQIMFPSVTAACNLPWPAMGWYCPTLQAFGANRMLVGSVSEQNTLNPSLDH